MDLNAILNGHVNKLLGLNTNMSENRTKICRGCPLYKKTVLFGWICSDKVWYNPETEDVSMEQRDGYVKGCGCVLDAKTRLPNATCPVGKW